MTLRRWAETRSEVSRVSILFTGVSGALSVDLWRFGSKIARLGQEAMRSGREGRLCTWSAPIISILIRSTKNGQGTVSKYQSSFMNKGRKNGNLEKPLEVRSMCCEVQPLNLFHRNCLPGWCEKEKIREVNTGMRIIWSPGMGSPAGG